MPRRTASQSTMLTGGTWLVPTVNLILVCDRFRREGLPTANLWVGTGMTEAICADPDALVSYEQAVAFFTNRSEEHTSELQSLMRLSYAVFCLKKKNKQYNNKHTPIQTTDKNKNTHH